MEPISSLNLAGAALWTQFAFILFLFITVAILDLPDYDRSHPNQNELVWPIFLLALGSIGVLLISQDISGLSSRLFGVSPPAISIRTAISITILMDTFVVAVLALATGGIHNSVFSSPLLSLVPIAIFLRTGPWTVIGTTSIIAVATLLFAMVRTERTNKASTFSILAFLVLTSVLGWITRPTS